MCVLIVAITLGKLVTTLEGGGGGEKSVWTPLSNTVELEERITNVLLK